MCFDDGKPTFGSLFTGFGGADIGGMAAGLKPIWGIEINPKIAEIGNLNLGGHIQIDSILNVHPSDFERVDVMHASPPCPSFSKAKTVGKETAQDFALADKVSQFIATQLPPVFTLENVWGYRNSESWANISGTLNQHGYMFDIAHVCAADYGVPQTRRRMIIRALRGQMVPYLPVAKPWVGWLDAIRDLIDELKEHEIAAWQLKRLPDGIRDLFLDSKLGEASKAVLVDVQNTGNFGKPLTVRTENQPSFTSRSSSWKSMPIAISRALRVVTMTPRCAARFQSFPDWYELPIDRRLATVGIGNAVPPLMMRDIFQQLLEFTN